MTDPVHPDKLDKALEEVRAEDEAIGHLFCGHCGGINDVQEVDLKPEVRHVCRPCRIKILEWI